MKVKLKQKTTEEEEEEKLKINHLDITNNFDYPPTTTTTTTIAATSSFPSSHLTIDCLILVRIFCCFYYCNNQLKWQWTIFIFCRFKFFLRRKKATFVRSFVLLSLKSLFFCFSFQKTLAHLVTQW